jgi:hypothetical protein
VTWGAKEGNPESSRAFSRLIECVKRDGMREVSVCVWACECVCVCGFCVRVCLWGAIWSLHLGYIR